MTCVNGGTLEKMSYTTVADIILLMNTELDENIIEDLITKADGEVDTLLAQRGLTVPETVPVNVQRASELFTCALIREREWLSGAEPDQYKLGEYSQTTKMEEQLNALRARATAILMDYAKQSSSFPAIFQIIPNRTDTNADDDDEEDEDD